LITLKEAARVAGILTDKRVPHTSTLSRWGNRGLIDKQRGEENWGKAGGRIGYYWDGLPVEIATACELKPRYEMKKIAWAAEKFRGTFNRAEAESVFEVRPYEIRNVLKSEVGQELKKDSKELLEMIKAGEKIFFEDKKEHQSFMSTLERLKVLHLQAEVFQEYIEIFADKLEEYKKVVDSPKLEKVANDK